MQNFSIVLRDHQTEFVLSESLKFCEEISFDKANA